MNDEAMIRSWDDVAPADSAPMRQASLGVFLGDGTFLPWPDGPMRGHDMSEMKAPLHVAVTLPRAWAAYIAELEALVAELEHSTKAGDRDYLKLVDKHDAALKRIAELEARVAELDEELEIGRRVVQLMGERIAELEAQRNTLTEACAAHNRVIGQQAARIMELEAEVCEVAGSREDDLFHLLDDLFHLRTDRDEALAERDARIAELELELAGWLGQSAAQIVDLEAELAGWRDGVFVHLSMEKANVAADRDPGHDVLDAGRAVAGALAMPVLGGPVMWGTDDTLDCE